MCVKSSSVLRACSWTLLTALRVAQYVPGKVHVNLRLCLPYIFTCQIS